MATTTTGFDVLAIGRAVVDDLARVMDATTLPTLLLGGDPTGSPRRPMLHWGRH